MPRDSSRRDALSDAAIRVLARAGAHGLTHRAVDAMAGVPVGTTSRYFRTRAALLLVAAEAVRDRYRGYMELVAARRPYRPRRSHQRSGWLMTDAEQTNRDLYIARIELSWNRYAGPIFVRSGRDTRHEHHDRQN